MISILFNNTKYNTIEQKVFDDLNFSRILSSICPDINTVSYAVTVFGSLLQDVDTIKERQKAMQDFLRNERLLEYLNNWLRSFEDLKSESVRNKLLNIKDYRRTNFDFKEKYLLSVHELTALCTGILNYLRLYSNLNQYLSGCSFQSKFLEDLKCFIGNIVSNEAFQELGEIFHDLSMLGSNKSEVSCNIAFDDSTDIQSSISDIVNLESIEKINPKHKISKSDQNKEFQYISKKRILYEELDKKYEMNLAYTSEEGCLYEILSAAAYDLSRFMVTLMKCFEEPLLKLKEELRFYNFGLRYIDYFNKNHIKLSYPEIIAETGKASIKSLKSIELMAKGNYCPVPNDIHMKSLNIIIGANNSGKTVYLRSLGFAQIIAQAGLPVPMEEGQLPMVSNIFTQFASGEKTVGRFEEETKELSQIFDQISPNSLVLLNETFQSTSYTEIAEPFKDILDAFCKSSAKVFLVTHNQELISRFTVSEEIEILKFTDYSYVFLN